MTSPQSPYTLHTMASAEYAFNHIPSYAKKSSSTLSFTLFFAGILNAMVVLGISFEDDTQKGRATTPTLDVVIAQTPTEEAPDKAKYLAEFSQDGGGESDDYNRPSEMFTSNSPAPSNGVAPVEMTSGQTTPQPKHHTLVITRIHSNYKTPVEKQPEEENKDKPIVDEPSDLDLQIAQMTAELNQKNQQYAQRPKKLQLTASTAEHFAAGYMGKWVERIERIGNLNIPNEARNLSGYLIMEVELNHDGQLIETKILKSSGKSILDATAQRIVFLSTPYDTFPPKLRAEADRIEIIRTWEFNAAGLTTRFSDQPPTPSPNR